MVSSHVILGLPLRPSMAIGFLIYRLEGFAEISEQEVIKVVMSLNNKQCEIGPLPTWLHEEYTEYVATFITRLLFYKSLASGQFRGADKVCICCSAA